MELLEATLEQIADEKIRERWKHAGQNSRRFVAKEKGYEVGFLAVDVIPDHEHFIIYEIYVLALFRRRGIGMELLKAAENLAREHGYTWSLVTARTLSEDFSQLDLEAWYRKMGYTILSNAQAESTYVKNLRDQRSKQ
jgi:GNAT superfamily N-acetyltransferase